MFTVCPKCALTLVVTAADLRIAQGYVRCGRCLNVFNALARLSEERPGAAPPPPPQAAADADVASQPEAPSASFAAEDTGEIEIELDASILVTATRPPAAPQEDTEHETQPSEPESQAEPESQPEPEPKPPAPPPRHSPPAGLTPSSAAPSASSERVELRAQPASDGAAADASPPTNIAPEQSEEPFELVTARSRASLAWRLGAGALVLVLALQIINHHRDELAAKPALSGPLRAIYSAFDVKLAPRWNIRAYDVRQLGASVGGATPGEIVVHASVKNGASRPQPLPLLRVTLQDRFGNRIAARDVPPRDYLPSSVAPGSLLAAGSRVDATMVFVDPGPQAVGFEIDACLPIAGAQSAAQPSLDETRAVACAHGP